MARTKNKHKETEQKHANIKTQQTWHKWGCICGIYHYQTPPRVNWIYIHWGNLWLAPPHLYQQFLWILSSFFISKIKYAAWRLLCVGFMWAGCNISVLNVASVHDVSLLCWYYKLSILPAIIVHTSSRNPNSSVLLSSFLKHVSQFVRINVSGRTFLRHPILLVVLWLSNCV